jgi:acyl-CoA thioester hydrolase
MAHTYTHTIQVRFDECDVYGHLNNAMYLRYMQESAFIASADAGLDGAAFEQMGRLWLIRGHEIEYLQPLRAGDTVKITTWNVGYRRTLMRRAYEMKNLSNGAVVAKAHTDWVFLDQESLRPITIPPEVVAVYLSPEEAAQTLPKPQFPTPPPAPPGTFRVEKRVEWRDLDMMQHLNNAVYPSYAEDVAMQLGDHFGWSFKEWLEDDLAVVTHRTRLQYRQPATFEDTIEIATWLYGVRRTSATRYYAFHRLSDGELLAQMETLWALINVNTGRPTRLPERFQQILESNISSSQPD